MACFLKVTESRTMMDSTDEYMKCNWIICRCWLNISTSFSPSELQCLAVFVYSSFKCVNSNKNCFVIESVVKSVYLTIKGKSRFIAVEHIW